MRNSKLLIEHQCPQCGAPAVLEETERLFSCGFCRVRSYLLQRKFFRYVLPHQAPDGQELFYFPYWRFKGMLFAATARGIQERFVDQSTLATPYPHLPLSLGLRSQALKLRFAQPDMAGHFIRPTATLDQAIQQIEDACSKSLPRPISHQAHIGESVSLLYAPFYWRKRLVDAVLNQPVSPQMADELNPGSLDGGAAEAGIRFVPAICPQCGWDLSGEKDSLVLHCRNCRSAWKAASKQLHRLKFGVMPPPADSEVLFLPFWRIQAAVKGVELKTLADLIKVANLPRVVQAAMQDQPFRFWALAFKVRPRTFLTLTRNVTLSQPQPTLLNDLPPARCHPVNLPITEAVESLKICLAGFMKLPRHLQPPLETIHITPRSYALIYIPFQVGHHDLVNAAYHLSLNKNQLALATNL